MLPIPIYPKEKIDKVKIDKVKIENREIVLVKNKKK